MDFGELTIDGLIEIGALSSAIPEMDLRKILLLSSQPVIREGPRPNFQIMVANGQLETPKSTIELKFEGGDIESHEFFIVMEHLSIRTDYWTNVPSEKSNSSGHETRNPQFHVLFHAAQNS